MEMSEGTTAHLHDEDENKNKDSLQVGTRT